MTERTFNKVLKLINLPIGKEVKPGIIETDGTEVTDNIKDRWKDKIEKYQYTIENFDRIYILTDKDKVVGGVLLYGNVDMQIYVFPEYRKKGYASRFMKEKEIFEGQDATIGMDTVKNEDDLDFNYPSAKANGIVTAL